VATENAEEAEAAAMVTAEEVDLDSAAAKGSSPVQSPCSAEMSLMILNTYIFIINVYLVIGTHCSYLRKMQNKELKPCFLTSTTTFGNLLMHSHSCILHPFASIWINAHPFGSFNIYLDQFKSN